MDTTVAPRPLTSSRYVIGLATPADDADLRRLLRETPMPGPIQISLEREPDFFAAVRQQGGRHYTACVRDLQSGQLVAMGSRSVHELFVNGQPQRVGYLSQLRIAPEHRRSGRQLLRMGFDLLRQTRAADEAPFDITTIVTGNAVARRILEAGLPGLPRYTPCERILTMLLPVRRGGAQPPGVLPGTKTADSPAVRLHLHNAHRFQFAPVRPVDGLLFHVAAGGCVAVWDQRAFKQTVVRGYSPCVRRCRWLLRLPPTGSVVPMAHLAHLAVDNDDPGVLIALLDVARHETDCRWLAFALAAGHPFVPVVRQRYRPRVYESILYVVHEPATTVELDGRIPQLEVALL